MKKLVLSAVLALSPLSFPTMASAALTCPNVIIKPIQFVIQTVTPKPSAAQMAAKLNLPPELQAIVDDNLSRQKFEKLLKQITKYKARVERRRRYTMDWEPQAVANARMKLEEADAFMARGRTTAVHDMFGEKFQSVVRNTANIEIGQERIKSLTEATHAPEHDAFVKQEIKETEERIIAWKEEIGEEIDEFRLLLGHIKDAVTTNTFVDTNQTYMRHAALESMAPRERHYEKPKDTSLTRYQDSAKKLQLRLGINIDGDKVTFRANGREVTLESIYKVSDSMYAQLGRWREMSRTELGAAAGSWTLSILRSFSWFIDRFPDKVSIPVRKALGLMNATLLKKLYSKKLNDIVTSPLEEDLLIPMLEQYAYQSSNDEFLFAFVAQPDKKTKDRWLALSKMAKRTHNSNSEWTREVDKKLYTRMQAAEVLLADQGYIPFNAPKPQISSTITYGGAVGASAIYVYSNPNLKETFILGPLNALGDAATRILEILPSLPNVPM